MLGFLKGVVGIFDIGSLLSDAVGKLTLAIGIHLGIELLLLVFVILIWVRLKEES